MHVRRDQLKLTRFDDQRPRIGWSMPRIVENSHILYFTLVCRQCLFTCML
jgi:hypothetical protein